MATPKPRATGNSVGVVLPKELLAQRDLREGDTRHVVEAPLARDHTRPRR